MRTGNCETSVVVAQARKTRLLYPRRPCLLTWRPIIYRRFLTDLPEPCRMSSLSILFMAPGPQVLLSTRCPQAPSGEDQRINVAQRCPIIQFPKIKKKQQRIFPPFSSGRWRAVGLLFCCPTTTKMVGMRRACRVGWGCWCFAVSSLASGSRSSFALGPRLLPARLPRIFGDGIRKGTSKKTVDEERGRQRCGRRSKAQRTTHINKGKWHCA